VVFTVPEELNVLAAAHPKVFYDLLLRTARETLVEVAATPRHLGGQIGGLMVLHTWGQNLWLHPHVHLIIPGGAISPDGRRWLACPRGFFLPVKVLSRVFRGKLLDYLQRAHRAGRLPMTDGQAPLNNPRQLARFISPLYKIEWVVYAKPPITGGPEKILKYLARYVHRIAISNDRLESLANGEVTFRYKDYAHGNRLRRMTLPAGEFLRRLSQHILPRGFVRIRAFGFLANGHRAEKLTLIRRLLNVPTPPAPPDPTSAGAGNAASPCPYCGKLALRSVSCTPRPLVVDMIERTYRVEPFDTS